MKDENTQYEDTMNRRGWLLFFAALVLGDGAMMMASFLRWNHGLVIDSYAPVLILFTFSIGVILLNVLLRWKFEKKLGELPVGALQDRLQGDKDNAEAVSARLLKTLRLLRLVGDVYAAALGLIAMGIAFFLGAYPVNESPMGDGAVVLMVIFLLYAVFLLTGAVYRIRFPMPHSAMGAPEDLLSEEEFPILYRLAREARDAVGCSGEIVIDVNGEFNCGIAKVGDTYYITIGVILLAFHSEEELYSVLLHEFGHMIDHNAEADREKRYAGWLDRYTGYYFFGSRYQYTVPLCGWAVRISDDDLYVYLLCTPRKRS